MNNKQQLWKADLGNGHYKNPILYADYSDPDVIRVDDKYYMTASSFNYVPGLPILVSGDLVNWKLVNYAIKNLPFKRYQAPAHGNGVWAPSIRYHNKKFWIFFGMPDEGIFMVNTEDPYGDWSAPSCVKEAKGFIDPCPYWDDDNKAYIIHAYARSRIGFKSKLGIFPILPDGTKAIGEDEYIYDGANTQPTIEGPKVYKKLGYYYIFAPAGGVSNGWQTVLRSTNLYGPYEERIVMHQGGTAINGPHQGGLVDTETKEEWFVHFQDAGLMGRIVHLQPVIWKDNWPIIGTCNNKINQESGEPVAMFKKPDIHKSIATQVDYLEASDDFKEEKLNLMWQWMGNYKEDFYSLTTTPGILRLNSIFFEYLNSKVLWYRPNILTQKLICPSFLADVKIDYSYINEDEKTGIVLIGNNYAYLAIIKIGDRYFLQYSLAHDYDDEKVEIVLEEYLLNQSSNEIVIRIDFDSKLGGQFYYRQEEKDFTAIGSCYNPEKGTWVGAKLGLFAMSGSRKESYGYSLFHYIHVSNKDEEKVNVDANGI